MTYNETSVSTQHAGRVPRGRAESLLEDHLDTLHEVWSFPPKATPVSNRCYLELVRAVARLHSRHDGETLQTIPADSVYALLSDAAEDEIDALDGKLRSICGSRLPSDPEIMTIAWKKFKGFVFKVGGQGSVVANVFDTISATDGIIASKLDVFFRTGDTEALAELDNDNSNDRSQNDNHQDRQAQPATQNRAETKTAADTPGAATGHGMCITGNSDGLYQGLYRRLNRSDRVFANTSSLHGCPSHPLSTPGNAVRFTESGRPELVLGDEETRNYIRARDPRGSYIDTAREIYDSLLDWRSILGEVKGYMAQVQYVLFSQAYDDPSRHGGAEFEYEGPCTGIMLPHEQVLDFYGLNYRQARHQGVIGSAHLLHQFRRDVDPRFEWSPYNSGTGQARVVTGHGIPHEIIHKAKEAMHAPYDIEDWVNLITGEQVKSRSWSTVQLRKRVEELGADDGDGLEIPASAKCIKNYLHSLDQKIWSHSWRGVLSDEAYDRARDAIYETRSEDGTLRFPTERRRDQELRKLMHIYRYPKPLYTGCARFPRLKADHYNQLMNLPTELKEAIKVDRDVEADLAKAHLGSLVPIAGREGIDMDITERKLKASMAGDIDLWRELAHTFTDEVEYEGAARTAAKRFYSAVYGAGENEVLRRVCFQYEEKSGVQLSFDPFRPLLDHEMAKEVLEVRSQLRQIINERGGLEDATGRFIPLNAWDDVKKQENRWRGVLAYVAASYEQELMGEVFDCAQAELDAAREEDRRKRFWIWLYQADGCTIRLGTKTTDARRRRILRRIQERVDERAQELGVVSALEIE
jgi:hypothetical protein